MARDAAEVELVEEEEPRREAEVEEEQQKEDEDGRNEVVKLELP